MQHAMLKRMLEHAENMPPETRSISKRSARGGGGAIRARCIGFLFRLCRRRVFGTLGGLLGAMIFRRDAPPTMPPASPPPMPPPLPPI